MTMQNKAMNFVVFVVMIVAAFFLGKHGHIVWSCILASVAGHSLGVSPEQVAKTRAALEASSNN